MTPCEDEHSFPPLNQLLTSMQLTPMEADLHTYGFPPGFFVIKNVATGRVLDIESGMVGDGAPVILWPETETFLVDGMVIF